MHIFHKWSKWGELQHSKWSNGFGQTGEGMFQTRTCKACEKVTVRRVV